MQPGHTFDLAVQIRRRVDQKPTVKTFNISADGNARLCLWSNLATPCRCTVQARTVPLRQAAAGSAS
jgi:hypothetical protein